MSRAMLSVCVLVLAMCAPLRPALAEVARLQGVMVTEVEMERTLVSKPGWLRGLHFLSQAGTEITGPHIRVVLPGIWAGEKLCARITTLSGGYAAVVEYQVPADLAGNQDYVLDFEAKSGIVRQVTPENSGVSLERGPCAQDAQHGHGEGKDVRAHERDAVTAFHAKLGLQIGGDVARGCVELRVGHRRAEAFESR